MSNRYVPPEQAAIERYWQIGRGDQWRGQAEVFPRGLGPFLRAVPDSALFERELVVGQWGLIPWFAKIAKLVTAHWGAVPHPLSRPGGAGRLVGAGG